MMTTVALPNPEKGDLKLIQDRSYLGTDGNERYQVAISPGGCLYDPKHAEYTNSHLEAIGNNYKPGQLFDWLAFDLDEANYRLQDALNSRSDISICECCQGDRPGPVKDKKRISVCAQCGDANNLKVCGACSAIFYCSGTCQKAHWKSHKCECKRWQSEKGV